MQGVKADTLTKKWRFYDSKTFNIIAINNCFAVNYKENDIKPFFLIIKK